MKRSVYSKFLFLAVVSRGLLQWEFKDQANVLWVTGVSGLFKMKGHCGESEAILEIFSGPWINLYTKLYSICFRLCSLILSRKF